MSAMQASIKEAKRYSSAVSIAIVDVAGQLIHLAHMDGAPAQCREIARRKAVTAQGFGVPTALWQERLRNCSPAVQQSLPLQEDLALFGGGEPFMVKGVVVGAIGVSGATEQVDGLCAQAAAQQVRLLLGRHGSSASD